MRIEHVALWTTDLERCKQFYASYFGAVAGVYGVGEIGGGNLQLLSSCRVVVIQGHGISR